MNPESKNQSSGQPQAPRQETEVPVVHLDNTPKKRVWLVPLVIAAALLLAGGGAYAFLRMTSDETPAQSAAQDTPASQNQTAESDCGDGKTAYDNPTYDISFCYPSAWGTVSLEDDKFTPADTGNRYRLLFSDKAAVAVGLVSDDWSTELGRGGSCADPSMTLPEGVPYAEEWDTQTDDAGTITYASRGLSTGGSRYAITESVDDFLGGVCSRAYANLESTLYRLATASYFAPFNDRISTPQLHIGDPSVLFTVIERQLFIDFVRTIE